ARRAPPTSGSCCRSACTCWTLARGARCALRGRRAAAGVLVHALAHGRARRRGLLAVDASAEGAARGCEAGGGAGAPREHPEAARRPRRRAVRGRLCDRGDAAAGARGLCGGHREARARGVHSHLQLLAGR
ncbi:unnamed protein product, partial [Prorocentrum cordatum]